MSRPYRILVLSRSYPNNLLPELGLWVKHLVHHCNGICDLKVISPVPYFPPIKGFERYRRFRRIVRHSSKDNIEVFHPRFLVGPGRSIHIFEALSYYMGIHRIADKLRHSFAFNLIHAHFIYPDGVVAAWLGRRYGVPVIVTEHGPWRPYGIEKSKMVRWQALWAARKCTFLIAVSNFVKDTIVHFTGKPEKVKIIPNGVNGSIFAAPQNARRPFSNQILFVGIVRPVKGVDILLKALRLLIDRGHNTKLVIVGEGFYQSYRREEERLRQMVQDLCLKNHVQFSGAKPPAEVARYMWESALLVLPSRVESFGVVLVEALACGKPVVATRCGGPEDIVNDEVGVLVPTEDPEALARGIEHVLERRADYDPAKLRDYALEKFAWERIAHRTIDIYHEALDRFHKLRGLENREFIWRSRK